MDVKITDEKAKGVCVVRDVDVKAKGTAYVSGYSLKNGGYHDFKIEKNCFLKKELNSGDVIRILKYEYKPKSRKNEFGKWVTVPNSKELWILGYDVLWKGEVK
jgi:hypothetical protein